ncbi:MAG: hypothetical protein KME13_07690 [Myxacorys californica WJT36-NPBG1]|jgi:hypothetical protein|nr:hypothetical protein [Myxacorys californica WJT36-NPBG1]
MNDSDRVRIEAFINNWTGSSGNERANSQSFFVDLCDALGVKRPNAKGSILGDPYCFEKDVKFFSLNGPVTSKFIDFYKVDHFIIEAKLGGHYTPRSYVERLVLQVMMKPLSEK